MPKKQVKILHMRGRNGSEYGRVGLYSGGELPKEYRGVGKLFSGNPNVQEITLISPDYSSRRAIGKDTEEDVFKRVRETDHSLDAARYLVMPEPTTTDNGDGTYSHKFVSQCTTFVDGEGWGPHEVDTVEDIRNVARKEGHKV